MHVHQILKSKSSTVIKTVAPTATVAEAIELLSVNRIGALVVSKDGETPEGILSERDVVREIGRSGAGILERGVDMLMTRDIVTCGFDETSDRVLTLMTEGRFRHIPVVADGRMVGLISIGDVVKARLSELTMEKDALEGMIRGY